MDRRGLVATRRAPGRFRCLPCRRYVAGTEAGHCPYCGFVPPSAPVVPAPVTSISSWVTILALGVAAIALVAALVTN